MTEMGLGKTFSRLVGAWKELDKPKRQLIGIVVIAVIGAMAVRVMFSARGPAYEVLFSNLKLKDSADIVAWLESQKVPYKLEGSGTTILVPKESVYKVRLQLASQGLPKGGSVGFELLDQSKVTSTDFERRTNYLRALQGELARTITEIEGVEEARVHVALPEESVFITKSKPASAAVFVKLKPGVELTRQQVSGIIHLVSKSVQDLTPENVVVVDYTGVVLRGQETDQGAGGTTPSSALEFKREFEKTLEDGIKSMLERVMGAGNVSVRASAELNLDKSTVTKAMFSPVVNQEGIARSIHQLQETFRGTGSVPGGPAGTPSNVPGFQGLGSAQQSDYTKTETTRNFEINEIREQVAIAPGTVKRLSVAVLVNRDLEANQAKDIETLVAAAIGFDATRRDQISVVGMPFDTSLADMLRQEAGEKRPAGLTQLPKWVVPAAACALGALLLLILLRAIRRRRAVKEAPVPEEGVPAPAQVPAPVAAGGTVAIQIPETESEKLKKEIEELARTNPETVAQLLRGWLSEERR